jgi:hypothetical protein
VGETFLTTAACRFVLFLGTIAAVRFFEVLVAIRRLSTDYADYTDWIEAPYCEFVEAFRLLVSHLCNLWMIHLV